MTQSVDGSSNTAGASVQNGTVPLFRLEQAISDARRRLSVKVAMVFRTPGELIELDHRQERLDWMRAECRADDTGTSPNT